MSPRSIDVAVVGGGLAGMIAAVAAAQAGLRAVVLERSAEDRYLCNSRITGGVFHCALRAADTPADILEQAILANRGPGVNAALARAIAHDVLPAIRWLQSLGVRFMRASADPWHRFVLAPPALGRTGNGWRNRGGDTLLRDLEARLLASGGEIRLGHSVQALVTQDGQLRGLRGDGFSLDAYSVVIADGGFQQDHTLVAQAISPRPDRVARRNAGTGWGDGFRMARAIGAARVDDMSGFYGHVVSQDALLRDDLRFYPWLDEMARFGMAVTLDGRRFCDESGGGIRIANQIAALPDPASATVIWDEAIWRGPATARFLAPNPSLDTLGATVFRADTIAELAGKAGISPSGLVREVTDYNRAVSEGTLDRLTPARSVRGVKPLPILTPPFAAAPAAAGMTYTMGGLAVDGCSRVMAASGEPIANLFAVGGSSGGVEGGPRAAYVGGLAKAAATGWRAAQTIIHARSGEVGLEPLRRAAS